MGDSSRLPSCPLYYFHRASLFSRYQKNAIIPDMINLAALPLTYFILAALVLLLFLLAGLKIGILLGRRSEEMEWRTKRLDEVVKARIKTSRAVLGGQFSEQLAPFLPDFPYSPGDCRFIGKPIDLLVFRGMGDKEISEVIFVEVKSGKARALSTQEKKLREAVQAGRVSWEQYNVPETLTGSTD
jgi:hypothetical protein